ncbi:hypothetical protein [Desulfosporosinus fructosivorans]
MFERLLEDKDYSFVQELKDRIRGLIFLFIEKIKQTGSFITNMQIDRHLGMSYLEYKCGINL